MPIDPSQRAWPPPPGARALLDPPSFASQGEAAQGQWYRHQVYYPEPPFPLSPNTALQPRDRAIEAVIAEPAGGVILRTLQFSIPFAIYAITGSAIDVNGNALPIGLNPLDTFLIQIQNTIGDQLQTEPVLGSEVIGTARRPRLIGGVGRVGGNHQAAQQRKDTAPAACVSGM